MLVDRHVRACTPAPGAWTTWQGERLKVGPLEPVAGADGAAGSPPAELVVGRREVLVGTGTGVVRLGQVKPVGKRWMAAASWARGAHPASGAVLGSSPGAHRG